MNVVLSPTQVAVVGVVSIILAWLISLLIERVIPWIILKVWKKPVTIDTGRWVKTILVGAVAFGLAWWWYPATIPPFPVMTGTLSDMINLVVAWIPLVVTATTPYIGAAMTVYNLLLGYVMDPDRNQKVIAWLLQLLTQQKTPVIPPPTPPAG